jgi:hypothetical protein
MRPLLAASAFAGALLVLGLPVWAQAQTVTDLQPLTLRRPVNHVFHFTPDGRTATINREQAIHDDHKVELYRIWVATTGGQTQPVPVLDPHDGSTSNAIEDDPTGTRQAFRLAYGRVDHGRENMLLITATRTGGGGASQVDYTVYQLVDNQFRPVMRTISAESFCTAEAALRQKFGVAPLADASGPGTENGCPAGEAAVAAAPAPTSSQPNTPLPPRTLPSAAAAARVAMQEAPALAARSGAPAQAGGPTGGSMTSPPPSTPAGMGAAPDAHAAPPPETPAASGEDCADVNRQQHLTLCESYVFQQMHNPGVGEAKREEWSLRSQEHPQCRSADGASGAYQAGQRVWQKIAKNPKFTDDDKLQLIVAGCLPSQ